MSNYGTPRTTTAELASTTERTLIDAAVEHLQAPQVLHTTDGPTAHVADQQLLITLPEGHTLKTIDTEHLMAYPRRIRAAQVLHDAASFTAYLGAYKTEFADDLGYLTTIWADMDPGAGKFVIEAHLDDHGTQPAWGTHTATYRPRLAVEWKRWTEAHQRKMGQLEFASFLEENIADITAVDGMPGGADILRMALDFEARADMRFKSTVRLQRPDASAIEYVSDDDKGTIERMEVFNRFSLGIPVFWGGDRWRMDAKLRYAYPGGKLQFWIELRSDRVYEQAAQAILAAIRTALPTVPLYIGQHVSKQTAQG